MKISFENADKVNGLLTITVEEADYNEKSRENTQRLSQKGQYPWFPSRTSSTFADKETDWRTSEDGRDTETCRRYYL